MIFFYVGSAPDSGLVYPAALEVVEAGLGNLLSWPGSPRLSERLLKQVERLIKGTEQSFYCGIMLARESVEIRVVRRMIPCEDVAPYLGDLRLPIRGGELDALLCPAQSDGMLVAPALTLRDDLSPDYGLECSPPEGAWPNLLERLTAQGKCAPEKRDELLGFGNVIFNRQNAGF